jgi:hypothetical protein
MRTSSPPGPIPHDVAIAVRLADWLDDRYVDPIVGFLLPGAGDVLTTLVGLYPVFVAVRRRMPAVVVARMVRNLGIDLLVGAIPIVGDIFDFFYKAHRMNADLLLAVGIAVLVLVLLLAAPFVVIGLLLTHMSR